MAVPALAALVAQPVDWSLIGLAQVMGGVWCVHSLDRLIEPGPVQRQAEAWLPWVLGGAVLIGSVMVLLATAIGAPDRWPSILLLGVLGSTYRWAARLPLAKPVIITWAWVVAIRLVFTAPPVFSDPRLLAFALLIFGASTLCDLPDADHDRGLGRGTIVVRLGQRGGWIVALVTMLTATALAAAQAPALAASAIMVLPLWLVRRWARSPLWFPLMVDGAIALPGVVVLIWEAIRAS